VRIVNRNELLIELADLRGATFATVDICTEPKIKCPKTSGMQGRILKASRLNVCLNGKYENMVNNRRKVEGKTPDFQSQGMSWANSFPKTPVIQHAKRENFYVKLPIIRCLDVQYYLDGNKVDKSEIEEYLVPSSVPNQGLDNPVYFNMVKLENIRSVKMNGEELVVA
jgi:hypothetical protein